MPIVDGYSATKMIRSFEKTHVGSCLSRRALCNRRVPIFAVSASLVEKDRDKYIEIGFDGWLLKPVDFRRVNEMLKGIVDDSTRDSCLYEPGKWEQGGWFLKRDRQPDAFAVETRPSDKALNASAGSDKLDPADHPHCDDLQEGSPTPRASPQDEQ